ncbi:MAG: HAMP domain-containing protein [Ignavibacteriales bacterium]|nr:HAMP domain-containing protein [Ignavibacteriales bacterium]
MFRLKYKTKFLFAFIAFGIILVCLTGWITYTNVYDTLENASIHRLTALREIRKKQVEDYLTNCVNQLMTVGEDASVQQYAAISTTSGKPASFQSLGDKSQNAFEKYTRRFGFKGFYLFKGNSGTGALFLQSRQYPFKNMFDTVSVPRSVIQAYERMNNAEITIPACLSDFFFWPSFGTRPVACIAYPVMLDGKKVGVVVGIIESEIINNIMTSEKNWEEQGFGATGETYLVGSDYLMRSDSRFFLHDGTKQAQGNPGQERSPAAMAQKNNSVLKRAVKTVATSEALKGITNTGLIQDYRGEEVLSSYTPLRLYGLQWAVVAEIDTREAFSSVYALRESLIMISVLMLLLGAVIAIIISRIIAKPINTLIAAADNYAKGNLAFRTHLNSKDEFEVLGKTMNVMAVNLEEHSALLKKEIAVRAKAEGEVLQQQQRLRDLSSHLQSSREEERKGIAREIHDELGQLLNTLKIKIILLRDEPGDNSGSKKLFTETITLLDSIIQSVKRIITNLRPQLLDDLGLIAAIEWQAREFQNTTHIETRFNTNTDEIVLNNTTSISAFRILQEALTNISRHAHANKAVINLTDSEGGILLAISDNGIGLKQKQIENPRSFGIIGMKERALYCGGELQIESKEKQGTTIILKLKKD